VVVRSVNVGRPRPLAVGDGTVPSGIVKEPVPGRVAVGATNLDGDGQADLTVHGGVDKAVYAYPLEHYAHWRAALGRDDLSPGRFGENLTTEGLLEDDVLVGDVLRIGSALLEVSQPRVPCFKLAARMDDPAFARPFLRSGRVGFYLRVLEQGELGAGDAIVRERRGEGGLSIRAAAALLSDGSDADALARAAAVPALAEGWRESFAARAERVRSRRPAG
jgi:MOSC domain-containing protein YiiM